MDFGCGSEGSIMSLSTINFGVIYGQIDSLIKMIYFISYIVRAFSCNLLEINNKTQLTFIFITFLSP